MFALEPIDSGRTSKICVNIFVSKKIDTDFLTQFCANFLVPKKIGTAFFGTKEMTFIFSITIAQKAWSFNHQLP